MTLRQFLIFTAITLPSCILLVLLLDQPLALFVNQYLSGGVPFFAAYTALVDAGYSKTIGLQILHLPALWVLLIAGFVVFRWVLRQRWGTVFLIVLLTHLASQASASLLKGTVHRLRPEVLLAAGYQGLGFGAATGHNDSFPSGHVAGYFSLFMPLAVAFPRWQVPLLVLPTLILLGRLVLGEHYLSDVWFSLWLVAGFTYLFGLLGRRRATNTAALMIPERAKPV
ncbi:phosphatase PAP2 family protein [Hymenobacter sp. BT683]|uniref:Phosphatase PAP2 family protein n=1 Tax=Hymenobacter jeongseonensis TaxID=2791027 RepID=A0ABS0IHF5_9BACT|nr:phosphatase PAP2 family protein [Hymenobacter jeongseonensis]MBF9237794.1 phosphatase PAP2 family protein [Hymenobacter jeongseonensis]